MVKAKIAVLVSGGGTNLQALINAEKSGILKSGEIALVVSNNENAYALTRASDNGIAASYIPSKSPDFEAQLKRILSLHNIDIIVLAGFMKILSADFTNAFENKIINVHPSLIPSFCGKGYYGLKVHEEALAYGVKVTGATVHYVNEVPDGGNIIMQKAVYVEDGDTPEILQKRVMEQAEWLILPESTELLCQKIIKEKNNECI